MTKKKTSPVHEIVDFYERDEYSNQSFYYLDPMSGEMNSAELEEINNDTPISSKRIDFSSSRKKWVFTEKVCFELKIDVRSFIPAAFEPGTSLIEVFKNLLEIIKREDISKIKYSEEKGIVMSGIFQWGADCKCEEKNPVHRGFYSSKTDDKKVFIAKSIDVFVTFVNFILIALPPNEEEGGIERIGVEILPFRILCKCPTCGEYFPKWKKSAKNPLI